MSDKAALGLSAIVIVLVAYPLVMRLLAHIVEPSRVRMTELGKELLASPKLSEREKLAIDSMLDDAFSWQSMIIISLIIPYRVFRRFLRRASNHVELVGQNADQETQAKVSEYMGCFIRSIAASNPIFAIIASLELAVVVLLLFPLGAIARISDFILRTIIIAERRVHNSF